MRRLINIHSSILLRTYTWSKSPGAANAALQGQESSVLTSCHQEDPRTQLKPTVPHGLPSELPGTKLSQSHSNHPVYIVQAVKVMGSNVDYLSPTHWQLILARPRSCLECLELRCHAKQVLICLRLLRATLARSESRMLFSSGSDRALQSAMADGLAPLGTQQRIGLHTA